MFDTRLKDETINELRIDKFYKFTEDSRYFKSGICPDCDRKTCFILKSKPGQVACSHQDSCGYTETVRNRYEHLFVNLSKRYPATPKDPDATANAYMAFKRNFPLKKISNWFSQGTLLLKNGGKAPTVRFQLWDGFHWERIINESDVETYGDKCHLKAGTKYKNKGWQPPGQEINKGDKVFIVEGIFHAIAFYLTGHKVIAAIASGNLPRDLINKHKDDGITWALAYDNDANGAGNKAVLKYRQELRGLKQDSIDIYQCPKGEDWDGIYAGKDWNGLFLDSCLSRGRINTAESLREKSYWLYIEQSYSMKVVNFYNKLYCISTGDLDDKLEEAFKNASQLGLDGTFNKDFHKKTYIEALKTEQGKQLLEGALETNLICNCFPEFLYAQSDQTSGEVFYNFAISFPKSTNRQLISISGGSIDNKNSFKKALLSSVPGARFKGSDLHLEMMSAGWFDDGFESVEAVSFIGYAKECSTYIFNNFAFHEGRYFKLNKSGYVNTGKTSIKTSLKIPITTKSSFDGDWIDNYITTFDYNGLCCLAFFMGSLFSEQIRAELGFFPFLEFTGDAGAGKTSVLEFCWKLLGRRDYEGFNPVTATFSSRFRSFAQMSNLPIVLTEGDSRDGKDAKKGGFNWDEIKELFGGRGMRKTSKFNNSNETIEPPFRGSVVISMNTTVDATEATLTRIVHLHATREHQRKENKPLADWFRRVDIKEVHGFLYQALSKEKTILKSIFENYKRINKVLSDDHRLKHPRVIDTHSLVAALVHALKIPISNLQDKDIKTCESHLHHRAVNRQSRLNADHPTIASFWEIYDLLHVQTVRDTEMAGVPPNLPREVETLNHSNDLALIAINLQEFHVACEKARMERIDLTELRKLLPGCQLHQFLGHKTVRSGITEGKTIWCAVFKKNANTGS